MVFVVDDLVSWLVGRIADVGYNKVSTRLRGSEQDRALRQAITAAVQVTVTDISSANEKNADQLAQRISDAFGRRAPVRMPPGRLTRLEALRAGIAGQLTVLEDPATPATAPLGMPAAMVADRLTAHLIHEISARGSEGGPLEPLANQLDHDLTHSQLEELKAMANRLLGTAGAPASPGLRPAGQPLEEVTDPFEFEVHRPVESDVTQASLPLLPLIFRAIMTTSWARSWSERPQERTDLRCWSAGHRPVKPGRAGRRLGSYAAMNRNGGCGTRSTRMQRSRSCPMSHRKPWCG